jgi:hypothetical protein
VVRAARLLLVAGLAAILIGGVFHSHGLPRPQCHDPSVLQVPEGQAGPQDCLACRLSEHRASLPEPVIELTGPLVAPDLLSPVPAARTVSRAREPHAPRAPPVLLTA